MDKKAIIGAGSAKVTGGGRGACEALHHEGRSPGSSVAVQLRPIHQRLFSYTVKADRSCAVTVMLALWAATTAVAVGAGIWEGMGSPVSSAQER